MCAHESNALPFGSRLNENGILWSKRVGARIRAAENRIFATTELLPNYQVDCKGKIRDVGETTAA
jgi:hypothetical protein